MREFGPLSDQIIPIQIRPDATVQVFGIPHDLTPAEAAKFARVISAFAITVPEGLSVPIPINITT